MNKSMVDGLVAGGLGLALLAVIGLDNLLPRHQAAGNPQQHTVTTPPSNRTAPLRLAVTQNVKFTQQQDIWDDMGKMLHHLGEPYNKFTHVPIPALYLADTYKNFDVLFFTCSQEDKDSIAIADQLRQFVVNGGTLYASDWRYKIVSMAFPECADPALAIDGDSQTLTADVVDPGLQDVIGAQVPLKFDLDQWKTAAFKATKDNNLKVLIQARYWIQGKRGQATAPLLVKFQMGKGNVIFTSFHNEKQNSAVEEKLLKYLVFSAVNANLESQIHTNMVAGGFSPQKSSLLSASNEQEVTYTYHAKKAGTVRFTLGFNGEAKLRLTVRTPDGREKSQEGTSEFSVEENGPAGDWRYTIRAIQVPSANFSFNLQIGEKN